MTKLIAMKRQPSLHLKEESHQSTLSSTDWKTLIYMRMSHNMRPTWEQHSDHSHMLWDSHYTSEMVINIRDPWQS